LINAFFHFSVTISSRTLILPVSQLQIKSNQVKQTILYCTQKLTRKLVLMLYSNDEKSCLSDSF